MLNNDLQLALELADVSDRITLRHFRGAFSVSTKNDQTPVTGVDEAAENALRDRRTRARLRRFLDPHAGRGRSDRDRRRAESRVVGHGRAAGRRRRSRRTLYITRWSAAR